MPFILNEDKALKTLLKSRIGVTDSKNNLRTVGVWFGHPDVEIRDQSYPYMTIELSDISHARERQHSGMTELNYIPEAKDLNGNILTESAKRWTESPTPVNLDYQIASYCRQPLHDRQILATVLTDLLPFRFGMLEIPEDNTARRIELLGYAKRDTTEQGKRLFVNVFSIRVNAELFSTGIVQELNSTGNTQYSDEYL
jgi:hypothetical protein